MKTRPMNTLSTTGLLAALALLGGCADLSLLEPRADDDRFYFLEETPAMLSRGIGPSVLVGSSSVAKKVASPSGKL